jgi:hypothetical protein
MQRRRWYQAHTKENGPHFDSTVTCKPRFYPGSDAQIT